MLAILKKEINSFFASPIGYLVIAVFLVLNGLFLWLFKGEFNILDNGFADLSSFFLLAPWILIFLIPAVTMRSFSDEKKQGTLELLVTKPISHLKIVLGKYFGAFILILLALLPTLLYVYTVHQLGNPLGNLDVGSTLGSYFGLLFLVAAYTAIGLFASSITDNQIVAFITAVLLCFIFYIGFQGVAELMSTSFIEQLGMSAHYNSMSRGVIDTRDIFYFLSLTVFFLYITTQNIQVKILQKRDYLNFLLLPLGLLVVNIFGAKHIYERFDLTEDKRYTINEAALQIIDKVDSPIIIDVFLEGEGFPTEFRRLQSETKQLLEEFQAQNRNIQFNFINPIEDEATRDRNMQQLNDRGLIPMQLTVQESGKSSQEVIFPWALASHNDVTVKIPLVKNKIGATQQELVTNSVQHLEYAFADGFSKLINPKRRKVAILRGNNQLEDRYIFDFVKTIGDYYFIAPFTLDSVASNAQKTSKALNEFDLIISAKPTEAFSENEKYVLDQYTMNGGKSLWLLDNVAIEKDSLYNPSGKSVAIPRDLNLTDFFFQYGARINPVLVNDLYSAPITLASGDGSQAQFQHLPWYYSPLVNSENKHAITNNLNLVKFDFSNQIDTLKNKVDKTILLQSSVLTKLDGTPREVSLEMTQQEPNPQAYNKGKQTLAVLLEGKFKSVYEKRIKPFSLENDKELSEPTKMIIIADGDIIKNDVGRNGPQELGFDKWTGQTYGNKEFLLNAVNYLLDDDGLINIRTKEIAVAFLDHKKVAEEKTKWQIVNILLPLVLLGLFGFLFNFIRKKKYAR
ncbi:gliding motility-associated ABC transporter substrate-binding protein GldG [Oceanihabitans sediminis]|uniref:gliding motility-associated ABC transporter substrate-binding protein GldG n=1 Tax=Oceanihabitans sediminis TaxID=1812012 RepID=UPI00299E5440|nr:gliding motility-associated ABC transporter substrate-binding protein GldG [Oceanihabitans sediminis]MDX1773532.1 gliding motility-associated ABC transporter substrate-binding protein GldG [Oceanihabitans sediminis]